MTSRLLFAAARGARVQYLDNVDLMWVRATRVALHQTKVPFRIHHDDVHLQYGPVSTALRDIAANPSYELMYTNELGTWSLLYSDWCACRDLASERDVSLFLLILAEALADEGL